MNKTRIQKAALIAAIAFALPLSTIGTLRAQSNSTTISVTDQDSVQIVDAKKINPTTVEILFSNEQKMLLDFYGNNIFRMFQDNSGKGLRAPEAKQGLPYVKRTTG